MDVSSIKLIMAESYVKKVCVTSKVSMLTNMVRAVKPPYQVKSEMFIKTGSSAAAFGNWLIVKPKAPHLVKVKASSLDWDQLGCCQGPASSSLLHYLHLFQCVRIPLMLVPEPVVKVKSEV